jgi:hypothetical protein
MTKEEKTVQKMALSTISPYELPEKFSGIAIDIYPTDYGNQCHITFLLSKPFTQKESDSLFEFSRDVKNTIKKFFGDRYKSGISVSTSTVDSYESHKWWYEEKKLNKKDNTE